MLFQLVDRMLERTRDPTPGMLSSCLRRLHAGGIRLARGQRHGVKRVRLDARVALTLAAICASRFAKRRGVLVLAAATITPSARDRQPEKSHACAVPAVRVASAIAYVVLD